MLLLGYFAAQVPVLLGALVDAIGAGEAGWSAASPYLESITGFLLIIMVLNVARRLLVEDTATLLERDAIVAGTSSLLRAPLERLGATADAAIGGNLNRSVVGIVKLVKLCFLDALPALSTAAFALGAAMSKHLLLGAMMAVVVPLSLALVLWQMASQRGIRIALLDVRDSMDGMLGEQLGGIESVRAAHTFDYEVARLGGQAESMRTREYAHHVAMAKFDAAKNTLEGLSYVAVIAFALALRFAGQISSGDILAISLLYLGVLNPLREIHRILDEAHESGLRAERFFAILDAPADPSFSSTVDAVSEPDAADMIEVSGLSVKFAVPVTGKEVVAVDEVSLAIRRGEVVGLAGPSGAGKSTLVRVILRLVQQTSGSVRIAGTDVTTLSRAAIARQIGYVSQKSYLFTGTIAENIAYGVVDASHEQIVEAAKQANIHDEILQFPGGYSHRLIKRGDNLSGGQGQRIALARIFLRQPPILILDEATAALDNVNERAVMDALSRAVVGRTVLMIAHRLSTLQRADRIIVFEGGRIAESGDFATLSKNRNGVLARLLCAAAPATGLSQRVDAPQKDRPNLERRTGACRTRSATA